MPVAFPGYRKNPISKVISDAEPDPAAAGERRTSATHVTYFFNGYEEPPFKNEYRVVIPSEPIPHPDEHPQMMAAAITDHCALSKPSRAAASASSS